MRHSHAGLVMVTTLTEAVRSREDRPIWIPAHQVPTAVSLPASAVSRFLASEHRWITRTLYRRPARGR